MVIKQWGAGTTQIVTDQAYAQITFPLAFAIQYNIIGMHFGGDAAAVSAQNSSATLQSIKLLARSVQYNTVDKGWLIKYIAVGR